MEYDVPTRFIGKIKRKAVKMVGGEIIQTVSYLELLKYRPRLMIEI